MHDCLNHVAQSKAIDLAVAKRSIETEIPTVSGVQQDACGVRVMLAKLLNSPHQNAAITMSLKIGIDPDEEYNVVASFRTSVFDRVKILKEAPSAAYFSRPCEPPKKVPWLDFFVRFPKIHSSDQTLSKSDAKDWLSA